MLNLSALEGNKPIKEILAGRTFHACLVEGGNPAERKTLSDLLAMSFFCGSETKPCGNCPGCVKYRSGNHPDLIKIDGSTDIKGMRAALDGLYLLPNEADTKVYLIENAEELSVPVQNVLLKPIEEPPAFAAFVLVCESSFSLLETIRSRCTLLALAAHADPAQSEAYRNACDFLDCLLQNRISELFAIADFKNRDEQKEFMKCAALAAKRKLSVSAGTGGAQMASLAKLCGLFDELCEKLTWNVNVNLWNTYAVMRCVNIVRKG